MVMLRDLSVTERQHMKDDGDDPDHAVRFREIADKIDRNRGEDFAGAYVVVGPDGKAYDLLLLDTAASAAIFWASLKTRVDIVLAEIEMNERQGSALPVGGFRRG